MMWVQFLITSGVIVLAAIKLAEYGDVIAVRTRLGGLFIGTILIAAATSLPEVLTTVSAVQQSFPNLAAGNLLGSNTFNMFLLAVLDVLARNERILRKVALKHALSGSLAIFMIGLGLFFMIANLSIKIGWVGVDSLLIMLGYFAAMYLIQSNNADGAPLEVEIPPGTPSLATAQLGFGIAAGALLYVTPYMVSASAEIAEVTGLGTTFVGSTLVAAVTSLPEMVTTLAALRLGAYDMAVGNLFGSNLFNMFALGLTDVFYTPGRFLAVIDPSFLLVGMLGLLMTGMGLIGNLARLRRRMWFIEADALALAVLYFGGMYLLYLRGISP
jgi:cation:H+ antiporter